jgi:hypothetical protein
VAVYQFYSVSQLQKMYVENPYEVEIESDDNLVIGFKKNAGIGDSLLELIYLSREIKEILYDIVSKH